jgi:predicted outer membrane repeat protein
LLLRHNTFFGNSATGDGGALYLASGTTAQVEGNLFEGNTGVGGPDIFVDPTATITSLGYNLLEDGTDSGLTDGVNNDIVGASAMLGPLADNGGPT